MIHISPDVKVEHEFKTTYDVRVYTLGAERFGVSEKKRHDIATQRTTSKRCGEHSCRVVNACKSVTLFLSAHNPYVIPACLLWPDESHEICRRTANLTVQRSAIQVLIATADRASE